MLLLDVLSVGMGCCDDFFTLYTSWWMGVNSVLLLDFYYTFVTLLF